VRPAPALASLRADDAIHRLAIELLGDEGEAQLLSDGADEDAPHRVLLPPGLFMIAAIVVPRARLNIAITLACLDAASCSGAGGFSGFIEHQVDFGEREARDLQVEFGVNQGLQANGEMLTVPAGVEGELVVCQDVCPAASRCDRRNVGTLFTPRSLAASTRPCPAIISSSSLMRTGLMNPNAPRTQYDLNEPLPETPTKALFELYEQERVAASGTGNPRTRGRS
jgi:hypothetical protein